MDNGQEISEQALALAAARDAIPGLELGEAAQIALARAIESAARGADSWFQKGGEAWFGSALQRSWGMAESQERSKEQVVAEFECDCEASALEARVDLKISATYQESRGFGRAGRLALAVRCEAIVVAHGKRAAGACSLPAQGPATGVSELRRVALLSARRASDAALGLLRGQPGFKEASRAALEARQIRMEIGAAGCDRPAAGRRAL